MVAQIENMVSSMFRKSAKCSSMEIRVNATLKSFFSILRSLDFMLRTVKFSNPCATYKFSFYTDYVFVFIAIDRLTGCSNYDSCTFFFIFILSYLNTKTLSAKKNKKAIQGTVKQISFQMYCQTKN